MIDKNMIALAEIRNGYTLPKYGNLTFEQNLLIKYDNLCLKLIEENQKYKEVIDKLSSQIKLYGKYNGEKCTRGFSMMAADFNKLLDILKEVE